MTPEQIEVNRNRIHAQPNNVNYLKGTPRQLRDTPLWDGKETPLPVGKMTQVEKLFLSFLAGFSVAMAVMLIFVIGVGA